MITIQELRDHYRFTDQDAELLLSLQSLAEYNRERFSLEYYDYLYSLPETAIDRIRLGEVIDFLDVY